MADQLLQALHNASLSGDLILLNCGLALGVVDLRLLLFDCVDEHYIDSIVSDAFNLAAVVAKDQQRLDLSHLFCCEAEVVRAVRLPGKGDGPQAADEVKPSGKRLDVVFITQARSSARDDRL